MEAGPGAFNTGISQGQFLISKFVAISPTFASKFWQWAILLLIASSFARSGCVGGQVYSSSQVSSVRLVCGPSWLVQHYNIHVILSAENGFKALVVSNFDGNVISDPILPNRSDIGLSGNARSDGRTSFAQEDKLGNIYITSICSFIPWQFYTGKLNYVLEHQIKPRYNHNKSVY